MKLIVDSRESVLARPVKPIVENVEVNGNKVKQIRFSGIFMEADIKNKNGRIYPLHEISSAVAEYQPMIRECRALGELEHPESASVDLERVCMITESLKMQDGTAFGTARVLDDLPLGRIVASLMLNGVKLGTSSRGLGDLVESTGAPKVQNFQYVCNDIIHDPSAPRAFINGILESKDYVLEGGVICERSVNGFERSLRSLPLRDRDNYLATQIQNFLKTI